MQVNRLQEFSRCSLNQEIPTLRNGNEANVINYVGCSGNIGIDILLVNINHAVCYIHAVQVSRVVRHTQHRKFHPFSSAWWPSAPPTRPALHKCGSQHPGSGHYLLSSACRQAQDTANASEQICTALCASDDNCIGQNNGRSNLATISIYGRCLCFRASYAEEHANR